jgi:hypothetical protein
LDTPRRTIPRGQLPLGVKLRRTQYEQISSGLPPESGHSSIQSACLKGAKRRHSTVSPTSHEQKKSSPSCTATRRQPRARWRSGQISSNDVRNGTHYCRSCPRTPRGVSPKRERNNRLKCEISEKPTCNATSEIRRGGSSVSSMNACCSRSSLTRSLKDAPDVSNNRCTYRARFPLRVRRL